MLEDARQENRFGQIARAGSPKWAVTDLPKRLDDACFASNFGPIWEQIGNRTGNISPTRLRYQNRKSVL